MEGCSPQRKKERIKGLVVWQLYKQTNKQTLRRTLTLSSVRPHALCHTRLSHMSHIMQHLFVPMCHTKVLATKPQHDCQELFTYLPAFHHHHVLHCCTFFERATRMHQTAPTALRVNPQNCITTHHNTS